MDRIVVFLVVIPLQITFAQSFHPGYFITLDGKRIDASIKFKSIQSGHLVSGGSVPGKIKIKPTNESSVYELTADEIKGFVMGTDSFVVMRNIPVSETDHIKRDFVKVEVVGKLTLLIHCSRIPNGRYGSKIKKVYIVLPEGTTRLTAFHNRYQKDKFVQMIDDDPELSEKVKQDWQWMSRLPATIREYNSYFREVQAKN
jgi:hypothetical protein